MTQYINKDGVVAEIKRLSAYLDSLHEQKIIEKILSIIDTLEVKELNTCKVEPASEDLEQAFCYYAETIDNYPSNQDDEKYMYDAFQAGAQWQKEQMMKDAIPGYLHDLYKSIDGEMLATVTSKNAFPYKKHGLTFEDKDKIKLIIFK